MFATANLSNSTSKDGAAPKFRQRFDLTVKTTEVAKREKDSEATKFAGASSLAGFLDAFRTLCIDPKGEIRSVFEKPRGGLHGDRGAAAGRHGGGGSSACRAYADVGERFGVSRTHVRKLLVAAEGAGLVKPHARRGHRVEILPRLCSSHDRGIAGGMYLHDILYMPATKATTHHDVMQAQQGIQPSLR